MWIPSTRTRLTQALENMLPSDKCLRCTLSTLHIFQRLLIKWGKQVRGLADLRLNYARREDGWTLKPRRTRISSISLRVSGFCAEIARIG